jgi:hypothetical protein
VRPGAVVIVHPLVKSLLRDLQSAKHPAGVELDAQGAVETLDLARRGGLARLCEQVVYAVFSADAVEEYLHWRPPELPGEHLAVVSQYLLGTAVGPQCSFESVAHQLSALIGQEPGRDTEARVVVDPCERLGAGPILEQEAVDHVHLPELHWLSSLPALPGFLSPQATDGVDDGCPDQAAVHR